MKYIFRETDCGDGRRYRWLVGKGGGRGLDRGFPLLYPFKNRHNKGVKIFLTPPSLFNLLLTIMPSDKSLL